MTNLPEYLKHRFAIALRAVCFMSVFVFLTSLSTTASAQELRYSWFEISYLDQDVDRIGSQTDINLGQTVDIEATDGDGIRFRGSIGTWHNLYAFLDYASSDIDQAAVITNSDPGSPFFAADNFDHTSIRVGGGLRFPVGFNTDIYGEVSFDYLDLDFGSFAGEDFDVNDQDLGSTLGIRTLIKDKLELSLFGRYTPVGDTNLNAKMFEADTLVGAGFGLEVIRGLSITGEFESGEHSRWSVGFRLDLSEDERIE